MTVAAPTKDNPAPLDGFESAKPDEPIWTAQGGDPLAPALLRIWSYLARIRAGVIRVTATTTDDLVTEAIAAAQASTVEGDSAKVRDLKIRATATEEISWTMQEYAAGVAPELLDETPAPQLDALAKIDLHSTRVRCASRLSNMEAELIEVWKALREQGFTDDETLDRINTTAKAMKLLYTAVEPRRFHKG